MLGVRVGKGGREWGKIKERKRVFGDRWMGEKESEGLSSCE